MMTFPLGKLTLLVQQEGNSCILKCICPFLEGLPDPFKIHLPPQSETVLTIAVPKHFLLESMKLHW